MIVSQIHLPLPLKTEERRRMKKNVKKVSRCRQQEDDGKTEHMESQMSMRSSFR